MKSRARVLPALSAALLLLAACGPDESSAAPKTPQETPPAEAGRTELPALTRAEMAAIWPESGSKVFTSVDLVVGPSERAVDGRLAVIVGGAPVAAGEPVAAGDGVQLLPPGQNHGEVTLPTGQQTVVVQLLDAAGKSVGPDAAQTLGYDVVQAPAARRVFFVEPGDGGKVKSPFHMVFGMEGMKMSKADINQLDKTVGHHHVLVRKAAMFPSTVIPKDETHIHYGLAQEEADLTLPPGEYELTLQFADGNHRSYGQRMAQTITVTVE